MQITNKNRLRTLLLANLLTLGISFHADAFTVMGARSCGEWVQNAQENGIGKVAQDAWLVGYLSGLASGMGMNVLKGTSALSLFLWVDNYCKNNPLDPSNEAGDKLFFELKKRAGL